MGYRKNLEKNILICFLIEHATNQFQFTFDWIFFTCFGTTRIRSTDQDLRREVKLYMLFIKIYAYRFWNFYWDIVSDHWHHNSSAFLQLNLTFSSGCDFKWSLEYKYFFRWTSPTPSFWSSSSLNSHKIGSVIFSFSKISAISSKFHRRSSSLSVPCDSPAKEVPTVSTKHKECHYSAVLRKTR